MKTNQSFFASHDEHIDLVERIQKLANEKNVLVVHNQTNYGKFDGYHRYIILNANTTNPTCTSRDVIDYWETRHTKYSQPSIRGERGCLYAMINRLELL